MSITQWKCALALCAFATVAWPQTAPPQPDITGAWDGLIAGKLRIVIRIEKTADQSLHGVLESPDQGNAKVAIDQLSFDGKRAVRFECKSIGGTYEGELSGNASEIAGTWQQGPARLPLTLRRPGSAPSSPPLAKRKPTTRGTVPLEPCLASDGETQALCGTFEVYENRASSSGRKIALHLLILPALSEKPAADPVFGFAGGPGQSAVRALPLAGFVKSLQRQRDIVLIDQRGTGKSNPLPCPVDVNNPQSLIDRSNPVEALLSCRAELETRADLTQYTTSNTADDVDQVRQALGYENINVVGASYGSLAALVYLRRHASHVRTIAIEGVVPPDFRLPLPFAKTIQSALEHLFAACAADSTCHRDFPNLKSEFDTIVQRLNREPAKFDFRNAASGNPQPITLSRGSFVSSLRTLLYEPAIVSQLPYILHCAFKNDWRPFAATSIGMRRALADEIARGMSFSVTCSESLPFIAETDIRHETDGTYLGDFDVRIYQKVCAVWPHASAPADFLAPVRSAVPALLIAGVQDPATPPSMARHAAETLPHSLVVTIPEGTHGTGSACIDNLFAQFVERGSEIGVDAGCVNQIHNIPFVTLDQVQKSQQATAH